MAALKIELKGYRCFPYASFTIGEGFTAILGPNNSGKSALLRALFELRDAFKTLSESPDSMRLALLARPQRVQWPKTILDVFEPFARSTSGPLVVAVKILDPVGHSAGDVPVAAEIELRVHRLTGGWLNVDARLPEVQPSFEAWRDSSLSLADDGILKLDGKGIANITSIFEACKNLSQTIYIPSFRNAINAGGGEEYFDIKVGTSFVEEWGKFQSGSQIASRQKADQVASAVASVFSLNRFAALPSPDDTTLILNVNGESFRLDELGSGIAHVFISFANVALRSPTYLMIDEPELGLHPTLQCDFLTALGAFARVGTLFATHNYGLARALGDRVYTTRMHGKVSEIHPLEATPRLPEFVGEMSFAAYRELGFKKLLLVEGPTEVKTVQQFLRKLKKDHQIVIVPLGGTNMIGSQREAELLELTRITNSIISLIDSERDAESAPLGKHRQDFLEICAKIGIRVHVLKRRAIENYFPDTAVRGALGEDYEALEPYQKLKDAKKPWGKTSNWRIAQAMDIRTLEGTDLGEFFEDL